MSAGDVADAMGAFGTLGLCLLALCLIFVLILGGGE